MAHYSATEALAGLGTEELRAAVSERYGQVASEPGGEFNFPVGRAFAEALGYPIELLDTLPAAASRSFTGVAYYHPWSALKPGEAVLDLGCGAGLDLLIEATTVGAAGQVCGVDVAGPMVQLARANATDAGLSNKEVIQSPVEHLPLESASFDLVTANGIINLAPEKEQLASEIARVLRPGGRFVAAEIVLREEVPASERATLADWFR